MTEPLKPNDLIGAGCSLTLLVFFGIPLLFLVLVIIVAIFQSIFS